MLNFGNQFPFRILFRILSVIVVNWSFPLWLHAYGQLSLRRGLNLEKSTHYLSIYLQRIKKPKGRHMKRRGPLIENGRAKWTNKWRLDIKIKVCFCLQKRMSPPVPQTVVIGKKSIWVTNKIKLQWITKKTCF
jgi:hypothetical protein